MIGHMKHRITFQEEVRTPDGGGGFTLIWQNISTEPTVWAKITPLRGSEAQTAQQLESKVIHRFIIRYRSDITAAHRISFDGRVFNIHSVININEGDEFTGITATEGGAV